MSKRIQSYPFYDVIIVGAGLGGLTSAALLARDGFRVMILEASHLPGGCSSSYPRKGYVFESGATTLTGFDEHQPLARLENMLGITFPKELIDPPMTVRMPGKVIHRYTDRKKWVEEAIQKFGNKKGQEFFWDLVFEVSDSVWRLSEKNFFFPPLRFREWLDLAFRNDFSDFSLLKYRRKSVLQMMRACGIDSPLFRAFIDEQLLITAQNTSRDTPFLFGAAAIAYTCYRNYSVPGGLIELARVLENYITERGGKIHYRKKVTNIRPFADKRLETPVSDSKEEKHENEATNGNGSMTAPKRFAGKNQGFQITAGSVTYLADKVIANIPIWNLPGITEEPHKSWFQKKASRYKDAWGAFVMGIVTEDSFPEGMALHQQIHLSKPLAHTGSNSIFVSFSAPDDRKRAPEGERVLNVSCHTRVENWDLDAEAYELAKKETAQAILDALDKYLPEFNKEKVRLSFEGTPRTFENWTYRHKGFVGGIPQSMKRSLFDWPPAKPPIENWYLVGDTVYPGQGIPGVTLGGIHAYLRIVADQSH